MSNFPVQFKGKALSTPARNPLVVPNLALQQAVLAEWEALEDSTKPDASRLPLTGFTALTLDVITPHRADVTEELLEYAETDLLCYREGEIATLRTAQNTAWQPWLDWAAATFNTHYNVTQGIIPITQPTENKAKHRAALVAMSDWQLACLAAVVKPASSLILGLAFMAEQITADALYHLSRLEESHNITRWGQEEEAGIAAEKLHAELVAAENWRDLIRKI